MKKIPKRLRDVLAKAPLSWSIVSLMDYKSKKKTANQIIKEYNRQFPIAAYFNE